MQESTVMIRYLGGREILNFQRFAFRKVRFRRVMVKVSSLISPMRMSVEDFLPMEQHRRKYSSPSSLK